MVSVKGLKHSVKLYTIVCMKRALCNYGPHVPQSAKWSEHWDLGIEYSSNGQNIVHVIQANCPAVFFLFLTLAFVMKQR